MTSDPITQDDLQALVDGELDERRRDAVEAHLAADAEAAATVADWRRQNAMLGALYGPVRDEAVPERLRVRRLAAARRPLGGYGWRSLAAALALVAVGAAGGWTAAGFLPRAAGGDRLVAEATEAHALYAGEVLHPVEVRADDGAHLRQWLAKRLDRPLNIPDLRSAGLVFVGGRLLPSGGDPAAQLMYEDDSGRRLTLYVVPSAGDEETALSRATVGDLVAISWQDETIRCALVGELPRERMLDIARLAYSQII